MLYYSDLSITSMYITLKRCCTILIYQSLACISLLNDLPPTMLRIDKTMAGLLRVVSEVTEVALQENAIKPDDAARKEVIALAIVQELAKADTEMAGLLRMIVTDVGQKTIDERMMPVSWNGVPIMHATVRDVYQQRMDGSDTDDETDDDEQSFLPQRDTRTVESQRVMHQVEINLDVVRTQNVDFLLKDLDFPLKNVDLMIKTEW